MQKSDDKMESKEADGDTVVTYEHTETKELIRPYTTWREDADDNLHAKTRRREVQLPPDPQRAPDPKTLIHKKQNVALVHLCGPGYISPSHEHCGIRILGFFKSRRAAEKFLQLPTSKALLEYDCYVFDTHKLAGLAPNRELMNSPDTMQEWAEDLSARFERHLARVSKEFLERSQLDPSKPSPVSLPAPERRNTMLSGDEKKADNSEDDDDDDDPSMSTVGLPVSQSVAVMCVIPHFDDETDKPDYSRCMVSLFAGLDGAEAASKYAQHIHPNYSEVEMFPVTMGEWLFPVCLGTSEALDIPRVCSSSNDLAKYVKGHQLLQRREATAHAD